jgi:hypothetical protein
VHTDDRPSAETPQQEKQVVEPQRDASGRRLVSGASDMHEDGAASTLYARPHVAVENDDDIVEIVIAPKPLCARRIRV